MDGGRGPRTGVRGGVDGGRLRRPGSGEVWTTDGAPRTGVRGGAGRGRGSEDWGRFKRWSTEAEQRPSRLGRRLVSIPDEVVQRKSTEVTGATCTKVCRPASGPTSETYPVCTQRARGWLSSCHGYPRLPATVPTIPPRSGWVRVQTERKRKTHWSPPKWGGRLVEKGAVFCLPEGGRDVRNDRNIPEPGLSEKQRAPLRGDRGEGSGVGRPRGGDCRGQTWRLRRGWRSGQTWRDLERVNRGVYRTGGDEWSRPDLRSRSGQGCVTTGRVSSLRRSPGSGCLVPWTAWEDVCEAASDSQRCPSIIRGNSRTGSWGSTVWSRSGGKGLGVGEGDPSPLPHSSTTVSTPPQSGLGVGDTNFSS